MDLHLTTPNTIRHIREFPFDYEGKVVATLIESRNNQREGLAARQTILYVHGFSDYFFQEHLMEAYNQIEVDFYAIDLRKYGRSLLAHQHPNFCRSLKEYFEDLDYAIDFIKNKNPQTQLVLMGHSTGGLLVSYYAHYGALRDRVVGLILNSPFLDFNMPKLVKSFIPSVADLMMKLNPYASFKGGVSDAYGESLLKRCHGEWEFNEKWKPIHAFPAFYSWISAVAAAQTTLKKKSLDLPILLMHSDKSLKLKKWIPQAQEADLVLNVADIERIGLKMGTKVTHYVAQKGLHDLFLSRQTVRNLVFEQTQTWLNKL